MEFKEEGKKVQVEDLKKFNICVFLVREVLFLRREKIKMVSNVGKDERGPLDFSVFVLAPPIRKHWKRLLTFIF